MRGIREKTLQQKLESLLSYQEDYELLKELIDECQELNPWITLEEFLKSGFEGECWINLANCTHFSYFFKGNFQFDELSPNSFFTITYITHVQPIHKPEPPANSRI